jgi:hypothetical protein
MGREKEWPLRVAGNRAAHTSYWQTGVTWTWMLTDPTSLTIHVILKIKYLESAWVPDADVTSETATLNNVGIHKLSYFHGPLNKNHVTEY